MAKKKSNYLDNASFMEALLIYKEECVLAKNSGLPRPKVPEYIGECFLKLSTNFAKKLSFSGYSFKEDMIGDSLVNCLEYMDNFDPAKSKNPFAYFTQYVYFAFLRKIDSEKKYKTLKFKLLDNMDIFGEFSAKQENDNSEYDNTYSKYMHSNMREDAFEYDEKRKKKQIQQKKLIKKPVIGVSQFLEDSSSNE